MKILLLGHGRHGKDTVAELIEKWTSFTFTSSSLAALDVIQPVLSLVIGNENKEELFADRHVHRELWKRLISLYNAADRSALCKKILEKSDIYVGMRCDKEFAASKHLFDWIIWVDASKRKKKDPTMMIQHDPNCMIRLDNNGYEDELEGKVVNILKLIGAVK